MQHSGDTPTPTVSYRRSTDISTEAFLTAVHLASGATSQSAGHPVDVLQIAWGLVGKHVTQSSQEYRTGPPKGVSRYAVQQKGRQLALRNALETFAEDTWLVATAS